jgi:hypothetical protein
MVQVQELLELFDKTRIDGLIVVTNFIFRWVQPYKDRVQPMYEYSWSADMTQESLEELPSGDRQAAGTAVRLGGISPTAKRDEDKQVDYTPATGTCKVVHNLTPFPIVVGLHS